ncbi:MAG: rhodanese-like domain-containing protein [Muribaculaceae bacterium]|nr:rhodanese-like domain-containing protein [Muribaculaceae bacterium]
MKKFILIVIMIMGLNFHGFARENDVEDMNVPEFSRFIEQKDVQLLDVRTPEEYDAGHIAGAVNIDIFDDGFLNEALERLDKSKPVAVYCRSGKRSADAANLLSSEGFKVTNLLGGILAWEDDKKPIEK